MLQCELDPTNSYLICIGFDELGANRILPSRRRLSEDRSFDGRNSTTPMKIPDMFAVITGASQGVGMATAHRFVQEGASVLWCARMANDLAVAAAQVQATAVLVYASSPRRPL